MADLGYSVLPSSLWVQGCQFDHVQAQTADEAVALFVSPKTTVVVVVPTVEIAREVLVRSGYSEEDADLYTTRTQQRIASGYPD